VTLNSDPSSHGLIQALSTALTRGFYTKAAGLDLIFIHGWTEVADCKWFVANEGIVCVACYGYAEGMSRNDQRMDA
jgi:hypothetical protein